MIGDVVVMTGGLLGSSIVTVVVEGLAEGHAVGVRGQGECHHVVHWRRRPGLPETVKLAELCPRVMVSVLSVYQALKALHPCRTWLSSHCNVSVCELV